MILRSKRRTRRRGAAVVETALVLGIFMLFLVGIIEYARFLFFLHVATNAASNAARYAVVHTGDGTTVAQVQTKCTDTLGGQQSMLSGYTVDVFPAQAGVSPPAPIAGGVWSDAPYGAGICVRVRGTYSFVGGTLIGIPSVFVDVSAVMTSEAN